MNIIKKAFLILIKTLIFLNALLCTAVASVGILRKEYVSLSGTVTISIFLLFALAPVCLYWLANRLFRFDLKQNKIISGAIKSIFEAMLSIPSGLRSIVDRISQVDFSKTRKGMVNCCTKKRNFPLLNFPGKSVGGDKTHKSINICDGDARNKNNLLNEECTTCQAERMSESSRVERGWLERIKASEAFQIFFVRARQDEITRKIYIIFFFCFVLAYTFFILSFDQPNKLDEMHTITGYFEGYYRNPTGGTVDDKISIRSENGGIEELNISYVPERTKKLNSMKGEPIKIFYKSYITPYMNKHKMVFAIQYRDTFISEYTEENYEWSCMVHKGVIILALIFAALSILTIRGIYKRHKSNVQGT